MILWAIFNSYVTNYQWKLWPPASSCGRALPGSLSNCHASATSTTTTSYHDWCTYNIYIYIIYIIYIIHVYSMCMLICGCTDQRYIAIIFTASNGPTISSRKCPKLHSIYLSKRPRCGCQIPRFSNPKVHHLGASMAIWVPPFFETSIFSKRPGVGSTGHPQPPWAWAPLGPRAQVS